MTTRKMSKSDFETLAEFRYALRRFLRFSEEATRSSGVTPLQYQLMLQIKGLPGRDWASVAELAERLQAKHHGVVALVSRCEAAGLEPRREAGERRGQRVRRQAGPLGQHAQIEATLPRERGLHAAHRVLARGIGELGERLAFP